MSRYPRGFRGSSNVVGDTYRSGKVFRTRVKRALAHTFLIDGVFGVGIFVIPVSGKHAACQGPRLSLMLPNTKLRTGLADKTIVAEVAAEG